MHRRPRSTQAAALTVAMAVVCAIALPSAAGARTAGSPLPAVLAESLDTSITVVVDCNGNQEASAGAGTLKVSRPNATSGDLDVTVSYGGSLVPGTDYGALPTVVTIDAGAEAEFLSVEPIAAGTVTMTIEPGSGYVVGDPATTTLTVNESRVEAVCLPLVEQTIEVGEAPTLVDPTTATSYGGAILDATFGFDGELPTGMVLDGSQISGVATTPGTYDFTITYCLGTSRCVLQIPYRIAVVAADDTDAPGAPTAPPATALQRTPSYTG